MTFEHEMTSSNKSLSETLREQFKDFEYESDVEEMAIFAVETVSVPSDDILATNLRESKCH